MKKMGKILVVVFVLLAMIVSIGCNQQANGPEKKQTEKKDAKDTKDTKDAKESPKPKEDNKPKHDMKEAKVHIDADGKDDFATFDGIKVRVNTKEDEFFAYNFFISLDDLKKLGELRGKKIEYDEKAKKLKSGDKERDVIGVDPKDEKSHFFKVQMVEYKGKPYFDTYGFYPLLGFTSASKMNDGVSYYGPKKNDKK